MPTKTKTKTTFQQVIEELAGAFKSDQREPYELRAMKAALSTIESEWPEKEMPEARGMLQHAIKEAEEKAETFCTIRDDAPAWTREADENGECLMLRVHRALDDRLPDDWVYATAASIAENFTNYDCENAEQMRENNIAEIADVEVDVYNTDRARWLASHLANAGLVDAAVEELGHSDQGIHGDIGVGQYFAAERIANALLDAVEKEVEARE